MDEIDKKIIQLLQADASTSVREMADAVGLTTTPCWRRIQALERDGVIAKRVALVDPNSVNLTLTALVLIRTNEHNAEWTERFLSTVERFEEVVEAYRTSGELDYLLKLSLIHI